MNIATQTQVNQQVMPLLPIKDIKKSLTKEKAQRAGVEVCLTKAWPFIISVSVDIGRATTEGIDSYESEIFREVVDCLMLGRRYVSRAKAQGRDRGKCTMMPFGAGSHFSEEGDGGEWLSFGKYYDPHTVDLQMIREQWPRTISWMKAEIRNRNERMGVTA